MKLKTIILSFITLLLSFTCTCYAQDSRIYIGKSWLRYDSDSNKIRIGGNPFPKIAREFDAQLFDFNTNQFSWDRSKGLCLNNLQNYDSTKVKRLIIYADTGDGETIPYRYRSYMILKPYYANSQDLFDLKVQYFSYNDISGKSNMTEINLLNTSTNLYENLAQQDISGVGFTPAIGQFQRLGTYLITINYEYEFVNAIDDAEEDINLIINYNSIDLRNYHHHYGHNRSERNNIRLPASIIIIIPVSDLTKTLNVIFLGNNAPSSRIYLYNLSISATLIN